MVKELDAIKIYEITESGNTVTCLNRIFLYLIDCWCKFDISWSGINTEWNGNISPKEWTHSELNGHIIRKGHIFEWD